MEKIHSYGIMVFGLFMFGFEGDDETVFDETTSLPTIGAKYDMCAYSVLTPYPGTLTWYQMKKAGDIVSYDWDLYDQGHIVYQPKKMTTEQLRAGHMRAYRNFYSLPSIARRFPLARRAQPAPLGHLQRLLPAGRGHGAGGLEKPIADATPEPKTIPVPPIMPQKREWREMVAEGIGPMPVPQTERELRSQA